MGLSVISVKRVFYQRSNMFKIMRYQHSALDAKTVSVHFTVEEARESLQSQRNGCMFIQYPSNHSLIGGLSHKKAQTLTKKPRLSGYRSYNDRGTL